MHDRVALPDRDGVGDSEQREDWRGEHRCRWDSPPGGHDCAARVAGDGASGEGAPRDHTRGFGFDRPVRRALRGLQEYLHAGRRLVSEVRKFQAVSGVRDILPPDSALWNRVEEVARNVFATYDFSDIRLPIFEETELFARSVGAASDIVGKEMY